MNAPLTKFVPFTVNVNPAEPAATLVGDNEVTVGTGFDGAVIVNVTEFDCPPPGVGFETTTEGVPWLATSDARIAAVSCVALTNVVVLATPPKITDELDTKFVPVTVNVNAADPAEAFAGEILLIVGTGLFTTTWIGVDVEPAKFASPLYCATILSPVACGAMEPEIARNVSKPAPETPLMDAVAELVSSERTIETVPSPLFAMAASAVA